MLVIGDSSGTCSDHDGTRECMNVLPKLSMELILKVCYSLHLSKNKTKQGLVLETVPEVFASVNGYAREVQIFNLGVLNWVRKCIGVGTRSQVFWG